jgi:hypothetical protein
VTVAELIEALSAYPPESEVYVMDVTYGEQLVARVESDRDQDPVIRTQ